MMTPGEPLIRWDWVALHIGDIGHRLTEHLILVGIAVAVGFALSFGLSLVIRRIPRSYDPITWVAGVLYTVPSLALFALLIPFTGLTLLTAEIGLVSYTLLILIRNIVGGLRAVPGEVRE
ncbi:MAG: ABC transporter permease, partial [Chloroflexi bacterium]|nr:ABC transporter permease [Chloroflexota bacterium]